MKIKHPKEHDHIVNWILTNPETFLTNIDIIDTYKDLKKSKQVEVLKGSTVIGHFDVILRFKKEKEESNYNIYDPETYSKVEIKRVHVFVNVKMESATEQLREIKKILRQNIINEKSNPKIKDLYVVVSENDEYKSFFTDYGYIFYKF